MQFPTVQTRVTYDSSAKPSCGSKLMQALATPIAGLPTEQQRSTITGSAPTRGGHLPTAGLISKRNEMAGTLTALESLAAIPRPLPVVAALATAVVVVPPSGQATVWRLSQGVGRKISRRCRH